MMGTFSAVLKGVEIATPKAANQWKEEKNQNYLGHER